MEGYQLFVESQKSEQNKVGEKLEVKNNKEEVIEASLEWNEKFQSLLEQNFENTENALARAVKLRELCSDFKEASLECGKYIIEQHLGLRTSLEVGSECKTKIDLRRIKKLEGRGVAGGEKYVHPDLGIFFKFCIDKHNIYGGDEGNFLSFFHLSLFTTFSLAFDCASRKLKKG